MHANTIVTNNGDFSERLFMMYELRMDKASIMFVSDGSNTGNSRTPVFKFETRI